MCCRSSLNLRSFPHFLLLLAVVGLCSCQSGSGSPDNTNEDNIAPPDSDTVTSNDLDVIEIINDPYFVDETAGKVTINVQRLNASEGTVTVYLATKRLLGTTSDTAMLHAQGFAEDSDFHSPGNYVGTYTQLTFLAGDTSKDVDIQIDNQAGYTGDLKFGVYLLDAGGGASIENDSVYENHKTITIADTDSSSAVGTLALSSSTYTISEKISSIAIQVSRMGGSDDVVSIDYATSDGLAMAGSDYTPTSGTLSWEAGDATSKTITIPIINNAATEGSETVTITLSNPRNLTTPSSPPSTGTIEAILTIVEPVIAELVNEDWESGIISPFWENQSSSTIQPGAKERCNIFVNSENPLTGTYSLEAFYAGSADQSADGRPQLGFHLGGQYSELWVKFNLFIPSNYHHRKPSVGSWNNKTVMMSNYSGNLFVDFEAWAKKPYVGDNVLEMQWKADGVKKGWIRPTEAEGGNYGSFFLGHSSTRNTWVEFVFHYKLATGPDAKDGRVEVWKNGVKAFDAQNLDHWSSEHNYFERGYIFGASNSGWNEDTSLYIDDIQFSTSSLAP